MRNLFDQYNQPENRLTHALMSALAADPLLLRRFLRWSVGTDRGRRRWRVMEQSLPGEPSHANEEDADRRGIPDGCIYDEDGWALLIECKFAARLSLDQLRRHRRTAFKRGLRGCRVLALVVDAPTRKPPTWVTVREWRAVYSWLTNEAQRSDDVNWAAIAAEYVEVAEMRGSADDYLKSGTLTSFAGIPFNDENPYTYLQGKRVLELLRRELLKDRRLVREVGLDPTSKGRGAITGRDDNLVWDYISLKSARGTNTFTQRPHLTIGVHDTHLSAAVTIPNGIASRLRSKMLGQSYEEFEALIVKVTRNLAKVMTAARGSSPVVVVVQRRYPTQRSKAIIDSQLRFDPRTALPGTARARGGVKAQPEWLRMTYDVLRGRRSNLQLQVAVQFPYAACKVVHERRIADLVADVWIACKPLIRAATD